jgi:hypothetical protein
MGNIQPIRNFYGVFALTALMTFAACSNSVTPNSKPNQAGERTNRADFRQCSIELEQASEFSVGGFFGEVVRNIEAAPTICLQVEGLNRDVLATLRVEYEDDEGIRYFESLEENIFFAELKETEGELNLEVIFIDDFGMFSVKGKALTGENFDGEIRYYNFLSYEEELELATEEQARKCRTGELTVAQCLGYNFPPTYWWNQTGPTTQSAQLREQARAMLSSPTRSRRLGSFNVDVSSILNN